MRSARAARPWAPAWWCRSRNRPDDWLARGRADLGTFPGYLHDRAVACVRLPACNGTPVHAFTTPRRASGPPQALPEECSSMARAPVSKFGFGHPGAFCHVPLGQCFRVLNALSIPPPYRPVLSRPVQLGSKMVANGAVATSLMSPITGVPRRRSADSRESNE